MQASDQQVHFLSHIHFPSLSVIFFFWIWLPDSTLRPVPSICNIKPCRIHRDCSVYPSVCPPSPPQFRATVSFIFMAALWFGFTTHRLPSSAQKASFYRHTNSCPAPAAPALEMSTTLFETASVCSLCPAFWLRGRKCCQTTEQHQTSSPKDQYKTDGHGSPSVL